MSVDVGSAVGYLDLDINGFLSGLRTAQSEAKSSTAQIAEDLSSGFQTVGNQISSVGSTMTKGLTVPLVGLGTLATTTAATFEKSMSQVQATMGITSTSMTTLDGATVNTMDALSALAKEMGVTTKFSAQEAAEAINNMAMAGYDTEQIYKALPEVLNLASAGALDLDYATQLAANGLNVMGLEVGDLAEMSDKMAVTASSAYGSVADFGEGLLVAGGQAKLANLSLTDTFTALGILSDNGISASEGGTMLRNTLKNLYTPTDSAASALERLGVETKTADGELIDFQIVLKNLKGSLDNLTEAERIEAMAQIFDTRTIAGANALLENSSERWDELSLSIDSAEGAASRMADTQLDNLSGQMTILKSSLEGLAIAFGELLMPMVKKVVEVIQNFVTWLNNLDEAQKEQIIKIAAIVAAMGPLLLIIGKTITGVGTLIESITTIGGAVGKIKGAFTALGATATASGGTVGAAFTAALGPIAAVVAIIAVLAAAFATLWKNNEEFRNKMTAIWDGIKEKFAAFTSGITERINALGFDFESFTDMLKALWEGFCELLAPIFEGVWQQVSNILSGVMDVLLGILDVFVGIFTGDWERVWEGIKGIFQAAWDFVVSTFENCLNVFKGVADTVLGWFGTSWDELWTNVGQFFVDTWNGIKQFFVDTWNSIVSFFTEGIPAFVENAKQMGSQFLENIVLFFQELPFKIGEFIGLAIGTVAKWVIDIVDKAKEMGTNFINAVVEFFTTLPGKIAEFITKAYNSVVKWATDMPSKAKEMGKNFIDSVVKFFSELPGKIWDWLTKAINKVKQWVIDMGTNGTKAIKNLIDNVVNGAKEIPGKMLQIGKNIVEGIWSGIQNAAAWFSEQVSSFFSGIVSGIKRGLGISSPSKVFADQIGKWLPPGIASGFKSALPEAINKMQDDLDKSTLALDKDLQVEQDISANSFMEFLGGFDGAVGRFTESVQRLLNAGRDFVYTGSFNERSSASKDVVGGQYRNDIKIDIHVNAEVANGYEAQNLGKDIGISVERELRSRGVAVV